ncbi:MAG TPA: hypothetical protein VIY56_13140 [Vicinamibacterales bacterium]
MTNPTGDSRRTLFVPHLAEPSKLRRCPICQWAVDQDHAEALAMLGGGAVIPSQPFPEVVLESDAPDAVAVAGFALV